MASEHATELLDMPLTVIIVFLCCVCLLFAHVSFLYSSVLCVSMCVGSLWLRDAESVFLLMCDSAWSWFR